ncbi:MAG: SDR family oxidoreductase, partial [Thermoanaerobaculia bacterium]
MALLEGKTGLIFGVANKRSIAWAIAQALSREGMRLAFTYQGERLKEGVESLSSTLKDSILMQCDVTSDAEIDAVYREVDAKFGRLDTLIHAVAFAPREDLENEFVKTS